MPIPQEGAIVADPIVAGAVMFGRGKNQCGVLIEHRPEHAVDPHDPAALVEFRNKIWCVLRVVVLWLDRLADAPLAGRPSKPRTALGRRLRGYSRR